MSDLKKALAAIEAAGIDCVVVVFSGGGDSGQIDAILYYKGKENVTKDYVATRTSFYTDGVHTYVDTPAVKSLGTILATVKTTVFDEEKGGGYVDVIKEVSLSPNEIIETHVYDALSECGVDWYNNGGGQGEYTFTLASSDDDGAPKWRYEFRVEVNYVECVTEHMAEGDVDDEEDEE